MCDSSCATSKDDGIYYPVSTRLYTIVSRDTLSAQFRELQFSHNIRAPPHPPVHPIEGATEGVLLGGQADLCWVLSPAGGRARLQILFDFQ